MSDSSSTREKTHTIHHLLVLDRSSSMGCVRDATISGFNENLLSCRDAEKDPEVEQKFSLVTFSDIVNFDIWEKPVEDIKDLNRDTYSPCGSTALYDALGKSVVKLKDEIREDLENQDANVIVTVFTDGQENTSKEYDFNRIKSLLEELRGSRMWTFTFVGCDESTLRQARSLGFSAANTMSYTPDKKGTADAFSKMSRCRGQYISRSITASKLKAVDDEAYNQKMQDIQKDFFTEDVADDGEGEGKDSK